VSRSHWRPDDRGHAGHSVVENSRLIGTLLEVLKTVHAENFFASRFARLDAVHKFGVRSVNELDIAENETRAERTGNVAAEKMRDTVVGEKARCARRLGSDFLENSCAGERAEDAVERRDIEAKLFRNLRRGLRAVGEHIGNAKPG